MPRRGSLRRRPLGTISHENIPVGLSPYSPSPATFARKARTTRLREDRVRLVDQSGGHNEQIIDALVVHDSGKTTQIRISDRHTPTMVKSMIADIIGVPDSLFYLEIERPETNVAMVNSAAMTLLFEKNSSKDNESSSKDTIPRLLVCNKMYEPPKKFSTFSTDKVPATPPVSGLLPALDLDCLTAPASDCTSAPGSDPTMIIPQSGSTAPPTDPIIQEAPPSAGNGRRESSKLRLVQTATPAIRSPDGSTPLLNALAEVRRNLRFAVDESSTLNVRSRQKVEDLKKELVQAKQTTVLLSESADMWKKRALAETAAREKLALKYRAPKATSRWVEATAGAAEYPTVEEKSSEKIPTTKMPLTPRSSVQLLDAPQLDSDDEESVELASIFGDDTCDDLKNSKGSLTQSPSTPYVEVSGERSRPTPPTPVETMYNKYQTRATPADSYNREGKSTSMSENSGMSKTKDFENERVHTAALAYNVQVGYYWPCCQGDILDGGLASGQRRKYGEAVIEPGCTLATVDDEDDDSHTFI